MAANHNPEAVAAGIASKLASRARRVRLLIGAGAGCSAGLPTLAGLEALVLKGLAKPDQKAFEKLLDGRNLEQALSRLRRMAGLLEPGEALSGIDALSAAALDRAVCTEIAKAVEAPAADLTAFIRLASWAARMDYQTPLEIFTINYDVLIERGLERVGAPYFDGFVGSVEAPFLPELVDPGHGHRDRTLPPGFVRLWKLHGSVNWRHVELAGTRATVRLPGPVSGDAVAIYPSDEKYEESRRVPFVVLMDRFRRALVEPETVTVTTGYSFGDAHLNEILFDAAQRHPRSEVVALCFSDIPAALAERAEGTRNLVVLAPTEAIIDGRREPWEPGDDIPGVFDSGRFELGDFTNLTSFLASQVAASDA